MADRPIIMSGSMVRAILDGRKSMTRRVLKDQDTWNRVGDAILKRYPNQKAGLPYAVGDRLWCRETWHMDKRGGVIYRADAESVISWRSPIHMPRARSRLTLTVQSVRVERLQEISEADAVAEGIEHVTTTAAGRFYRNYNSPAGGPMMAYGSFRSLWSSLHGPDAWAANPWVIVIGFSSEPRNIDSPSATGEDLG